MTELSCVVTNRASSHLVQKVSGSNLHHVEVEENASATCFHPAQLIVTSLTFLLRQGKFNEVSIFFKDVHLYLQNPYR